MAKILLIDDDALLRRSIKYQLEQIGHTVMTCDSGEEGLLLARREKPNLILLDIGLPDRDGLEIARTLQHEMVVPIIFITGRGQETDIVVGLELGAEDYITKPFGMRELLARVRVVLRRKERSASTPSEQRYRIGQVLLDVQSHQVHVQGKPIDLPPKEFELLRRLMANADTVLSANYLLDAIWGDEFTGAVQVLYVHIGWLRERIERDPRHPRYIHTIRGVGYKFVGQEEAQ
jgi:DNA-binding response OmpR family regulator